MICSSCGTGIVRDAQELSKVKSYVEISRPNYLEFSNLHVYNLWYTEEVEVAFSSEESQSGVHFKKGDRAFYDIKTHALQRYYNKDKDSYTCFKHDSLKEFYLNRGGCGDIDFGNWLPYKYSISFKEFPTSIDPLNVLIRVRPIYSCNAVIELEAVNEFKLNNKVILPGNTIILKKNKIWKVLDEVVDHDLDKEECILFRFVNYKLEY